MNPRRICFPLATRGNYGKMKSTMRVLVDLPGVEIQTVIGGGLVLEHYGDFGPVITNDGFEVLARLNYIVPGDTLKAMNQSAANCTKLFGDFLEKFLPDVVVIVADRYEALAFAQSAICMNIRIAHLEGGEVSGSIDERIRHAITKLAHVHFPSNQEAARRIQKMGEPEESIHVVGTPSFDLITNLDFDDVSDLVATLDNVAIGTRLDVTQNYIVVSMHPVVTEIDMAASQYSVLAKVVCDLSLPTVWVFPNLDAGWSKAVETVNRLTGDPCAPPVTIVGSLPVEMYAKLIKRSCCLIGNSSSGIREAAFLGVPSVNIGTRQSGRTRGNNVLDVLEWDNDSILTAIARQLSHGPYASDSLYGDGKSGQKIARILTGPLPSIQKTIVY